MTLIAHISDTHFGTEVAPVCAALREDILRHAPDLIVLTGDITQRARSAQFRAARAFLDGLAPIPVLALPGNHDLPLFDLITRFSDPYRLYRRYISPELAPAWQNGGVAVLGVNSTRVLRRKNGELPAALVQEVSARLASLPQRLKVVALHHPLAIIDARDRRNRARGAEAALSAWAAAGADLFLGGHIHLPYCICAGSGRRQGLVLQAGTAVSRRRRGRQHNSYNLVRLDPDGPPRIRLEQRDYDPRLGAFRLRNAWQASPGEPGWVLAGGETHPSG